jgi:hypothetical protein
MQSSIECPLGFAQVAAATAPAGYLNSWSFVLIRGWDGL